MPYVIDRNGDEHFAEPGVLYTDEELEALPVTDRLSDLSDWDIPEESEEFHEGEMYDGSLTHEQQEQADREAATSTDGTGTFRYIRANPSFVDTQRMTTTEVPSGWIRPLDIIFGGEPTTLPRPSSRPPRPNPYTTYAYKSAVDRLNAFDSKEKEMDTEHFYNKLLRHQIAFRNGTHKGDIGLEIECEGAELFRTPFKYWTCHEDGSLRAYKDNPPVEYVLRSPLSRDDAYNALVYLNEKLKETNAKVIESTRTSVHVHVNCQKLTIRELYCFICLYLIFEELLVDWSGPSRAGNLFCLRAKDSDFFLGMLERTLKEGHFKLWRDDYRYSACNVASIPKFGSLEFRSMQGTTDVTRIISWVDILLAIKEAALKYDNPTEIVEDFSRIGPLPFFKKILPDALRELLSRESNISGKLWDGLRMMRDVAYSVEWLPSQKKTKPLKPKTKSRKNQPQVEGTE